MTGRIHSFQSLGTVDGPGVRAVVFTQGCPLRCICCHNPDTWDASGGEEIECDTLFRKIERCRAYFGRNGGVTVSGGEPLLQSAFVRELFEKCHQAGIHTALDTSGCLLNDDVRALLDVTDLVLLDHKYATEEDYRAYTGGSLLSTGRFLEELEARKLPTWFRRVIIPGRTDRIGEIRALNDIARAHRCVEKIELLPFRSFCLEKYEALSIPFPLKDTPSPSRETMEALNAALDPCYR